MRKELARKAFHFLSLAYLAAFRAWGPDKTLLVLGGWILAEGALEAARLRHPGFNARLIRLFRGIHREKEAGRVSGIFWTALGSWLTILLFGGSPEAVTAALLYLALGDAAAALAGKLWGSRVFVLRGRTKSLEGSLACFATCLACGRLAGLEPAGLWTGAAAATFVELLPLLPDDNLWLPLISGAAVYLLL